MHYWFQVHEFKPVSVNNLYFIVNAEKLYKNIYSRI